MTRTLVGLCAVLFLAGCTQAPKEVQTASRREAAALVNFTKNMERIEMGWEAAFREESGLRLEQNFRDAVRENTDDAGKILVAKYDDLHAARETGAKRIAERIAAARSQFERAKGEAVDALRLHDAVARWMSRKAVEPGDVAELFRLGEILANGRGGWTAAGK